jgi:hypothetical protein
MVNDKPFDMDEGTTSLPLPACLLPGCLLKGDLQGVIICGLVPVTVAVDSLTKAGGKIAEN